MEKLDILLLQDSKTNKKEMENMIQKIYNFEGLALSSIGASGGIITLWRKDKWELQNQQTESRWIKTKLKSKSMKMQICLYNVFAPNCYKDK